MRTAANITKIIDKIERVPRTLAALFFCTLLIYASYNELRAKRSEK